MLHNVCSLQYPMPGLCSSMFCGVMDNAVNNFPKFFTSLRICHARLGPMDTELKQRKTVVHRKRTRPTESARPEEVIFFLFLTKVCL